MPSCAAIGNPGFRLHNHRLPLLIGLLCAALARGSAAADLSEKDYFSELPAVLTVTRLAQPLSETPGAVTILDRDKIRRSGARELADVLRLVPGYLVGGFNGANPMAAYHAPVDGLGVRNLVLIDGRSVYSGYYLGDTHRGMMGVLLEDIERIEVLRGSNSAAYGANAMFGVINIITRHTADTRGAEVSVTGGGGGIADGMARIGWGGDAAGFRLSAGRRSDSGYRNTHDDKTITQLHFRGDLRPAIDQELMLAAGVAELSAGEGFPNNPGNLLRTARWRDAYLHGQWRRQLSESDEIKLSASFDEEVYDDAFPYGLDPSITVSVSGKGRRVNLELQHQLGLTSALRAVWGIGYKYEEAQSVPLYARPDAISVHEARLFGNLEWRPHPRWLINAGGFLGRHSEKGGYFSPRLMANFHLAPEHTLRAGASESARLPTISEMFGDVRYYPGNAAAPFPFGLMALFGDYIPFLASRNLSRPEKLHTGEIGYFGNYREWHLTLDVRGYIERLRRWIDSDTYPNATPVLGLPWDSMDFVNRPGFKTHGVEYQLRWKPLSDTEIWLNQNFQRLHWDDPQWQGGKQPPTRATTLALFQKLPHGFDLSLMLHTMGAMTWGSDNEALPSRRRIDARLAWPFRIGSTKAEAALVAQSANGDYPEYLASKAFIVERRAFGTLRIEF